MLGSHALLCAMLYEKMILLQKLTETKQLTAMYLPVARDPREIHAAALVVTELITRDQNRYSVYQEKGAKVFVREIKTHFENLDRNSPDSHLILLCSVNI